MLTDIDIWQARTEIAGHDIEGQESVGVDIAGEDNERQWMYSFRYIFTRGFMAN